MSRSVPFAVQEGSSDPSSDKTTTTTTGLDANSFKNCRPVSNRQFLSKLLKKVVLHEPHNRLLSNSLCDNFQSAYRAHNSTQTALPDVMNCLLGSAYEGQVSVLTLLDLSAAFDTLHHTILLAQLHDMFGISGKALQWFTSYLFDRVQAVSDNGRVSSQKKLHYGVPQSSVLGPVLFILYIQLLSEVISRCRYGHHKFAGDIQLHQSSTSSDFHSLIVDVEQCVDSVGRRMTGNRLKLSNDKTEALLVGSRTRVGVSRHKIAT